MLNSEVQFLRQKISTWQSHYDELDSRFKANINELKEEFKASHDDLQTINDQLIKERDLFRQRVISLEERIKMIDSDIMGAPTKEIIASEGILGSVNLAEKKPSTLFDGKATGAKTQDFLNNCANSKASLGGVKLRESVRK